MEKYKNSSEPKVDFNPKHYRLFDSYNYRRKVKAMIELVKTCRGITSLPRPAPQLKATATANERAARMDLEEKRLSTDTIHWFAQPYDIHHRSSGSSNQES